MRSPIDQPGNQTPRDSLLFEVEGRQAGLRLDHFLVQHVPDLSRSILSSSIRSGSILVNGLLQKSSYRLRANDRITGNRLAEPTMHIEPENIPLRILHEDEYLLVLSKPPGLVVHPGSGNHQGTLVNGLVFYCQGIAGVGDVLRPGIVHRLDKDTSGVMLIAKNEKTLRLLSDDFKNRRMAKEYLALVHGIMPERRGRIVLPIGRHSVNRQKMAVRERTGRHAVTNWQVLDVLDASLSLVKLQIETGRTHQIRVHMSHLKHPVAGDALYGGHRQNQRFPRQMLHAARLGFRHPITAQRLDIIAPLWPDFLQIIQELSGTLPLEIEEFV